MSKYMIYNIQWDISDEDCNLHEMIGASLGLPDVFALGAETYPPPARIKDLAISSTGIRTATVSSPPVVP